MPKITFVFYWAQFEQVVSDCIDLFESWLTVKLPSGNAAESKNFEFHRFANNKFICFFKKKSSKRKINPAWKNDQFFGRFNIRIFGLKIEQKVFYLGFLNKFIIFKIIKIKFL